MSNRRKIDLRKLAKALTGGRPAPPPRHAMGRAPVSFPLVPRAVIDDLLAPLTEDRIRGDGHVPGE